jgi:hypothetical protein
VAKVLGVTVEYLLTGVHPDGLKNDAKELLGLFNELSEGGKELILGHTRLVYEQEKKESPEKRGKAAGASS